MRYLLILVMAFSLMGCISQRQLEAEQAYYNMQTEHIRAKQQQEAQPLFEMVAADNTQEIVLHNVAAIRVYQPVKDENKTDFRQYRQENYMAPWVNLLSKGLSIGVPAYATYKMVDAVVGQAGDRTYSNHGEGNLSVSGDTAMTNAGTGDMTVTGDSTTNTGSFNRDSQWDGTWDSYNDGLWDSYIENHEDAHNQTAEPYVVEQPEPIIVE